MRKWILGFAVLFTTAGFMLPAYSLNFDFMSNSAMASFNTKDWDLFNAAIDKALDSYPNGKKLNWSNPQTDHSGYVQPLTSTTTNGKPCRQLKIVSKTQAKSDQYQFNLCKIDGVWKIVTT